MTNFTSQADQNRLYEAHAAICRVLANPWRLRIVEALGRGERTVGALSGALGISMSNLSQHLSLMREKGVVEAQRSGGFVYYRLTSPKTLEAWKLMREVLIERLTLAGELSRSAGEEDGKDPDSRTRGRERRMGRR
jgi:ArsR family transcriptional regulator